MNIAKTMREVLPKLKEFGGIRFPGICPEVEEDWNENYAVVQGLFYDYPDNDYFDNDRFKADYEQIVRSFFPDCKVNFYWKSQEIEVCK